MNLRDQFLKAGLANKKQARKAKNAARKEANEKRKKQRQGKEVEDQLAKDIQEKQEAQKKKDQERNREILLAREDKEKKAQIADILLSHDLRVKGYMADTPYYFVAEGHKIHLMDVTQKQQRALAAGKMGIVRGGPLGEGYWLLGIEPLLKLQKLDASLVACLHPEVDGEIAIDSMEGL